MQATRPLLLVGLVVFGLAVSGCEQKSDSAAPLKPSMEMTPPPGSTPGKTKNGTAAPPAAVPLGGPPAGMGK